MPAELKKGSELRGRYVISDLLGVGSFATVWRATDKEAGQDVAIKRMLRGGHDEQELKAVLAEAKKLLTRISNLIQTSRPSGGLERLYS